MQDGQRPTKRPRLDRTAVQPDGPAPSKPSSRRVISAPVFVSGFDTPAAAASASVPTRKPNNAPTRPRPPNSTGHARPLPRPDFGRPIEGARESQRRSLSVRKPPVFDPASLVSPTRQRPLAQAASRRATPPSRPLPAARPSVSGLHSQPNAAGRAPDPGADDEAKSTRSFSILQVPKFDLSSISGPPRQRALSRGPRTVALHRPASSGGGGVTVRPPPRMEMPPPKVPAKPMMPLSALGRPILSPPRPKFPPGTILTTITSTRIAKATDINTEAGRQELLALYLLQHGTGYISPMDQELRRGLEQSPEKRNKAKQTKFRRCVTSYYVFAYLCV